MKTKAKAIGAVALLTAVVIVAYVFASRNSDQLTELAADPATSKPTLDQYLAAARDGEQFTKAGSPQAGTAQKVPVRSVFQRDTRLVALTPDEHAWLQRHHYPQPADLERAKSLSDADLQRNTSDPMSLTLWGQRLLERGNAIGAATVLEKAGSLGSIYAYEEAAVAQFKVGVAEDGGTVSSNQANALRARLEVTKILGDHRADALVQQYLPDYDLKANAQIVQLQTTEFLRQLGSNAQSQGVSMPGPDPRPNVGLWSDLQKLSSSGGSEDLTTIYGD